MEALANLDFDILEDNDLMEIEGGFNLVFFGVGIAAGLFASRL